MGYSRSEMEAAFRHFNETAAHGGATGDWVPWSECFTEDATYDEHHYGVMTGRAEILAWITETMSTFSPAACRSSRLATHGMPRMDWPA